MVLDDSLLRGSTILEQLSKRGVRVAAITAKDKLRKIINHGLNFEKGDISFSSQHADTCILAENGIEDIEKWLGSPKPSQYSAELSLFVLRAGVRLLEEQRADLFYLTLSDYIQHKHEPGSKEANDLMSEIDRLAGRFVELDAVVAITGDHGMSDKCTENGEPNVLFIEEELDKKYGPGSSRVICPITDPFVRHHGALGSFVRVYLNRPEINVAKVIEYCKTFPQVQVAVDGATAAEMFEMPLDREGDFVLISTEHSVIGSRPSEHAMGELKDHRLRSHGGLGEEHIPLLRSLPIENAPSKQYRNFDVFDIALNY
jgi:phosphonoacetate hydrolase